MSNRIAMPSFQLNLNSKNSIAFTWNVRTNVNVDGITQDLATLAYNGFDYKTLLSKNLSAHNLSIQTMTWAEYGITYGRVLKDDNEHFFKVGGTLKVLQGIQAAYMFVKDLSYNFANKDTISILHSTFSYGHSNNFEFKNGNTPSYQFVSSPGLGMDLGAVYEWRPDYKSYKFDMDGKTDLWRRDKNKYRLKVGFSILDIGAVKFQKGDLSHNFTADVGFWNLKPISPKSVKDFDDTLQKRFPQGKNDPYFYMKLPTAISTQIDLNVWKDFYLNLTPYFAFQFRNSTTKVHDFTTISFTPRYDHKWFGIFLPVQFNTLDQYRFGASIRLG
ncbi:MAG TPA: DUF5723 family protein, partial [Nitrosopumilaceae archaeon]|nr:DUF5723 family protein [Nitrosopumilaceae archaeon]